MRKNQRLYLFLFFLLCSGALGAQSINIEKFGAVKDGGQDATPAVRKALAYIRQHPVSRLIFPRGRYDFYPDLATEKYIYTTNNDDGLKRIVFLLNGFTRLEIDGQGSDFFFHGYINPFVIERSKNISLKNFSVDWERTFHSEGKILSVDKDGMELQFSEKYPYKIEYGMLVFRDKKGVEYPYGNLLEFDPATAGGMMNTDFAFVGEGSTREEVLVWMRGQELNFDQLDTIVLLDGSAQFSGTVPVARLLLAAADQRMTELKMEPLLCVPANADDKEVFELFDKYNLRMLTVIDKENRPIGAITVDDVVSKLLKD